MRNILIAVVVSLLGNGTLAFLSTTACTSCHTYTNELHAHISEWRDLMFDDVPEILVTSNEGEPIREVCIFPFPPNDVLLQGETKELCLYEKRFHNLFEKATNDHAGIVAMGFLAPPSGMLQCMPLCEVENYRTMEGDTGFGNTSILATIRVVGRAMLLDVQEHKGPIEEGFMRGWCTELSDEKTGAVGDADMMDVYNELADRCEDLFDQVVSIQQRITTLEEEVEKNVLKKTGGGETEGLSEATLKRMKLEAELGILNEDDDDDDDDDDDYLNDYENDTDLGQKATFQKAFQIAKASDTQGYTVSLFDDAINPSVTTTKTSEKRSIQDLTALSWAYFSKDVWREDDDDDSTLLKFRLQALNTVDLSDRLILVSKMLIQQKNKLSKRKKELE